MEEYHLRGAEIQGLWHWALVRSRTEESTDHIPGMGGVLPVVSEGQPKAVAHTVMGHPKLMEIVISPALLYKT